MATQTDSELYLQEQIARIRLAQEESDKFSAETKKLIREAEFMPRSMIFQAMIAFAAILGAGAALAKLFFP